MIYITGDIHGDQVLWESIIDPILKPEDTIFVTGDFGVGFFDGVYWPEEMFYDHLEKQQYTVLFCDGNHENFDKLNRYEVGTWKGGKVHFLRRNIIHLMRGEVYTIDGLKTFVMGGGYSIDKNHREEGVDWWPEEMPTSAEYKNAIKNLEGVNNTVDCIITHTAPKSAVNTLTKRFGIEKKNSTYEDSLTCFLEEVNERVKYRKWYFGHLHIDCAYEDHYALHKMIRRFETGEEVQVKKGY